MKISLDNKKEWRGGRRRNLCFTVERKSLLVCGAICETIFLNSFAFSFFPIPAMQCQGPVQRSLLHKLMNDVNTLFRNKSSSLCGGSINSPWLQLLRLAQPSTFNLQLFSFFVLLPFAPGPQQ